MASGICGPWRGTVHQRGRESIASWATRPLADSHFTPSPQRMSIRSLALDWLATRYRIGSGRIFTSKFYAPDELWTGGDTWRAHIPLAALDKDRSVHIVDQRAAQSTEFRYLRIPAAYVRQHDNGLATEKEARISRFRDAGPPPCVDRRGGAGGRFSQFEMASDPAPEPEG